MGGAESGVGAASGRWGQVWGWVTETRPHSCSLYRTGTPGSLVPGNRLILRRGGNDDGGEAAVVFISEYSGIFEERLSVLCSLHSS